MAWALQKPRAGGTRYSSQVKEYLKARFDAGEESGGKADPEQVAIGKRNARNKDNVRLFSREEWLSRNQIQAYFSRLFLKRKQDSASTPPQVAQNDMDDVVEEKWLQQADEVYDKLSVQHPIYYDSHILFDLC